MSQNEKIKEFHLNCDTTFLVHIGKENMKELQVVLGFPILTKWKTIHVM